MLSGERGRRVDDLFDQAYGMSPKEAEGMLAAWCPDDEEVRAEVLAMLCVPDKFLNAGKVYRYAPGYGKQYELKRAIGYGSSGVVWEAYDRKLRRLVAIKFISGATQVELST